MRERGARARARRAARRGAPGYTGLAAQPVAVHTDLQPLHTDLQPLHTGLQPLHIGLQPLHTGLQPLSSRRAAASISSGCSLDYRL